MATMVNPTKQLTKDPVCGMQVDPAKAITVDHNGAKLYFCSQGCATKFQADPDKYLKPSQAAPPKDGATGEKTKADYTCPMHPQIIRDEPGNCPICGMTLEPMAVTLSEANPELDSMTRRLWFGIGLTIPLLAVMVSDGLPSHPIQHLLPGRSLGWACSLYSSRAPSFYGEGGLSSSVAGRPSLAVT